MARDAYKGIIVGPGGVEWATLQRYRDGFALTASGRADIPPDAEKDAAAEIVSGTIKEAGARMHGPVTLGLDADDVLLRVLRLPATADADLAGMVLLQAEKLSPFPVDSMVIAHEVLQRGETDSFVVVAAARAEVVERYGEQVRAAGMKPRRVDAAPLGWWRVLRDAGHVADAGNQVHVLMTDPVPQLVVLRNGVPLVFRALAREAGLAGGVVELARELGFTLMSVELEHGALSQAEVIVWVRGGGDPADCRDLSAACGTDVRFADLDELAGASEGIARRGASGAALDLRPEGWIRARDMARLRRRMLALAAVVVGVWLLCVGGALGYLAFERGRLERIRAERESLREPALAVRETRRRVFMIRRYLDQADSALECLRELCVSMPPGDLELTALSYSKGGEVKISGEARSVSAVYDFKTQLDGSSLFPEATLQGPRTIPKGLEVFDVTLRLAGGDVE